MKFLEENYSNCSFRVERKTMSRMIVMCGRMLLKKEKRIPN
jgi:hypothetical protein